MPISQRCRRHFLGAVRSKAAVSGIAGKELWVSQLHAALCCHSVAALGGGWVLDLRMTPRCESTSEWNYSQGFSAPSEPELCVAALVQVLSRQQVQGPVLSVHANGERGPKGPKDVAVYCQASLGAISHAHMFVPRVVRSAAGCYSFLLSHLSVFLLELRQCLAGSKPLWVSGNT